MAGPGAAPKEVRTRARDNKRTELTWDGTSFWGEPLPTGISQPTKANPRAKLVWHKMTLQWWEAWRRWPALEGAHPVTWNYLLATALMVNQMWTNGRWDFAAEIRLREAKFGATPADLRSLGYDYRLEGADDEDDDEPKKAGTVTDLDSRRLQLVEEDQPTKPAVKKAATKKPAAKKAAAKAPAKKAATAPRTKKSAEPPPPY